MRTPEVPLNELERLAELADYDVLDTPAEAPLDALTTLAARLLGTPISLVSIVDADRQWFKSRCGLDAPETGRDVSFCGHVIAADESMVVPDATVDPRFFDNPLVTGPPFVRFYAGVPLRTAKGFALGTLCVIDHQSRAITADQLDSLEILARQVMAQLELRREQRKLAEERDRLLTFQRFFEVSHDLFCTANDTSLVEVSPAWERVLGWTAQELRTRPFLDFVHPDDVAATTAVVMELVRIPRALADFENRYRTRDGRWINLAWSATFRDGVIFAVARDVTAKHLQSLAILESAAKVTQSEARLRVVLEGMAEGVVQQDHEGRIVECNEAAERILGLTAHQLMGRTSIDPRWRTITAEGTPFAGDDHPAMVALRTGVEQRDVLMGVEKPSGGRVWISVNAALLQLDSEGPVAVVTTFRDVTRQRATDQALAQEREFLATVLENLPGTFVGVVDAQLQLHWGLGERRGLASDPKVQADVAALVSDVERPAVRHAVARGLAGEVVAVSADRGGRQFDLAAVPMRLGGDPHVLLVARDVSEREMLRDRIARQERLVTVGTLAAGVGHEINNPLQFVVLNLEFATAELHAIGGASPSQRTVDILQALAEAHQGAQRIRKIVRGLRSFARDTVTIGPVEVNTMLEAAAAMATHEVKHVATLHMELAPVPAVFAEEARLSQVFVNLLVNAAQAFVGGDPETNRIVVRTELALDGGVLVTVSDNGVGIAPEVLPRIYDPFFTTKPFGVGTGLGLAICYSIVTELGGEITCETARGQGSTFRVKLQAAPSVTGEPGHDQPLPILNPRGRVVVIDDEEAILVALQRILRAEHDVIGFSDARAALRYLLEEPELPDVVLCDVMMPYHGGFELLERVCVDRPALRERFVFISGANLDVDARQQFAAAGVPRLEKPFAIEDVRAIVGLTSRAASTRG